MNNIIVYLQIYKQLANESPSLEEEDPPDDLLDLYISNFVTLGT